MIEMEKIYTFEECAKLCGRDEYYFRRRAQEHIIKATAQDPNRPWMRAIYGKDLARHLQTVNWGQKLLKQWKIDEVHDDLFIDRDKLELEEKLKHLLEVKEQRVRALYITMCKIDEVKAQLEAIEKKGDKNHGSRSATKSN